MLDYSVKLTRSPGAMTVDDLAAMRAEDLSDKDILDVNQTVAYFAYVNRVADGLGVAIDRYAVDSFTLGIES
jgi:alkylhydroperoxidase family enzyme